METFSARCKRFQPDGSINSKMEAFSARWKHFQQDGSIFSKMTTEEGSNKH